MMFKKNYKWAQHSVRTAVIFMITGVVFELLVAVSGILIKYLFYGEDAIWDDHGLFRQMVLVNCMLGCCSTLLMCYGVLSYTRKLSPSGAAHYWLYTALILLVGFKLFDIVQTLHWQYLRYLFNLQFDLDSMITNLLIVGGSVTLLIGMMRALYDADRSKMQMMAQNEILGRQEKDRQRTESLIRTNEERLSSILNAISSPVFLSSLEGFILTHNTIFAKLWGNGKKDLTNIHLRDILPLEAFEKGKECTLKIFEYARPDKFNLTHNDRIFEVNVYPVISGDGAVTCVTVLVLDITDKLRHDEERRLLETAVSNAAECIIITDVDARIKYVNPAFENQTGYARHEVMERTPAILKSGKQDDLFYRDLWKTIKKGEVWRGRFINRCKDGQLFHEAATISPILNEQEQITHYVAVKRNITREHLLEQQLQQAQRIEALGTLAGGIAHDLNNVLAIILGRSELVIEMLEEQHTARESLEIIIRTATRSSQLIKRLLAFTRQGAGEASHLCIAPFIKEQIKTIRAFLPPNVLLVENILLDDETILADPGDVQQIVVNLLNNSNQAMQPDGGKIEIHLNTARFHAEVITTTGILKPGDYIRFSVKDTGCGMEDSVYIHIFDPFFTTKDVGEGTGLGLSIVHGSVLGAGGQIQVKSAQGEGTCFDIYWPEVRPESVPEPVEEEFVSSEGLSVLLVDDLEDFTDLLTMNLQNHGYAVNAFSEAEKAIAYFENHGAAIDIAVIDYMMPKMNGKQLAAALHEVRADLPIVLLSGYASGITAENAHEYGFCAIFDKPIEIEKLSRTLAKIVRESESV